MNQHLKDAKNLLSLADGREGPEDARHATQLVIARALISIAESLDKLADTQEEAFVQSGFSFGHMSSRDEPEPDPREDYDDGIPSPF